MIGCGQERQKMDMFWVPRPKRKNSAKVEMAQQGVPSRHSGKDLPARVDGELVGLIS